MTFQKLDLYRDGVEAIDLGIIGSSQFALNTMAVGTSGRRIACDVWRRRAAELGTYGGWRWECSSLHPSRSMAVEGMAELARRIALVVDHLTDKHRAA